MVTEGAREDLTAKGFGDSAGFLVLWVRRGYEDSVMEFGCVCVCV